MSNTLSFNVPMQSYGVGTNKPGDAYEPLPPQYAKPLGQAVEYAGDFLGLKEGGLSEMIAGGPTKNTDQRWYDAFRVKQAMANEPSTMPVAPKGDGFDMSKYAGWSEPEARADYAATGGPKTGGGTVAPQKSAVDIYKESNPYSDITPGWNPAEFDAQLNELYNNAMGLAGTQANLASQLKEGNLADIESSYGVGKQTLDTSKAQAGRTLEESGISAKQRQEQSLDSIRRLYDEVNRGYQQRFGNASSAGEAARAFANVEQQRQSGSTRQGYQDTVRQIETQKVQVEENYKNSLMELDQKKGMAVREANNNFSSAMAQIEGDKVTAANEKALAKMNLLKEYKTELFNIKAQEAAFKANLENMKQQAQIQLDSYAKQAGMAASAGQGASQSFINQTTTNPGTDLRFGQQTQTAQPLFGVKKDDQYTGQISPLSQYNPRNQDYFLR